MVALADARRRFPLPLDALQELIEGVRMDVAGTTYEDFDELVSTAAAWPAGSGACAWRSSACARTRAPTTRTPNGSPTSSAWRCS